MLSFCKSSGHILLKSSLSDTTCKESLTLLVLYGIKYLAIVLKQAASCEFDDAVEICRAVCKIKFLTMQQLVLETFFIIALIVYAMQQ